MVALEPATIQIPAARKPESMKDILGATIFLAAFLYVFFSVSRYAYLAWFQSDKFLDILKLPTAKAWGFLVGHYGGTPRFFLAPRMVEQLPCGPHPLGVGVLPSQRGLQRATLAGWSNVRCLEALDGTPGERSVSTTLLLSLV